VFSSLNSSRFVSMASQPLPETDLRNDLERSTASLQIYPSSNEHLTTVIDRGSIAGLPKKGRSNLVLALRAMRPHQWTKNVLVFAPLLLSHNFSATNVIASLFAFVALSLCASATYVLNDLLDLKADRLHPVKRNRPLASGDLRAIYGVWMGFGLLVAGISLSVWAMPWIFTGALALYMTITTMYSVRIKRSVALDIMVLACLYTLRILMGGCATGIPVSQWLLTFSMFLFTSLAFVKRYAELTRLADEKESRTVGRGYRVDDISVIESLGPASGYLAVLVFALYINSESVKQLYANLWPLWGVCPLLLYWITRIWLLAKRRELAEDPIVFALTDGVSRIVAGVTILFVVVASIAF